MASNSSSDALPVERAFVVHFGTTERPGRRLTGRVEHLASGKATHFDSLRGLLAFFDGFLTCPSPLPSFGSDCPHPSPKGRKRPW